LLKGAKAHVKNSFTSPIQTAAELGRFDLMEILISHGAKVNTKTISSPLHEAVRNEHKTVISYLIENGAKTDMQDGNMNTALHIAAEKNNAEIVQLLLKHGVPVNALNKRGNTALDSCKDNECRGLLLLAGAETAASIKG
jgi:ankyrin repeat protein